jgi:hypothetical protein
MATILAVSDLLGADNTQLLDDVLARVCRILQLSPTQYALAEKHYNAICEWLGAEGSLLNRFAPELYPQGSVALGTTVKPQFQDEYDVDLVCELQIDHNSVAEPSQLVDIIELRMKENDIYRGKLKRKSRCLCVNYEHDFHLDILPACPDPISGGTCLFVPDCDDRKLRTTNPKGFIAWFKHRAALLPGTLTRKAMDTAAPLPQPQAAEDKNALQLSVQLIKRWRNRYYSDRSEQPPASILLTTLMGNHYYGEQSIFTNLSASVRSILDSVPSVGRLVVSNPSHPLEDLSERWKDQTTYDAFLHGLRVLRLKLAKLEIAEDMGQRSALLQELFGERVIKAAFEELGNRLEEARRSRKIGVARTGGIVTLSAAAGSVPIPKNTFYGDRRQKKA